MAKIYVPYELPTAGGAGYRPATIPESPGFGGPPTEYPYPALASSPMAVLPDWFRYDPQVLVSKDGVVLGTSAKITGTPTAEAAENVTIKSDAPSVNGFVVKDDCKYLIRDTAIEFKGDGVDDFSGYGAGVQTAGESTLVLENSKITTEGVIRPCTSATDYSTLIVRNCELDSKGGVIDRSAPAEPGAGKAMKEPPAGLGLGGNCRTHLSVGDSHSYFYDSKIYAQGWAALSTDACFGDLYLEANRCDILHEDPQRVMALTLKHTKLTGRIENAVLVTDPASAWTATAESHGTITAFGPMGTIDALQGVTIYAKSDVLEPGTTDLPSGGKLVVEGQGGSLPELAM